MTNRSTYLFAIPSWKEGVGRLVDFGNYLTEYNGSPTPREADAIAIAQDWYAVGDDLLVGMQRFEEEKLGE